MSIVTSLKKMVGIETAQPDFTLGRNDACWCGSGRKYKSCHLHSDARKVSAGRASAFGARPGRGF
jgi:hypothetical protein